jgi:hypothetical protein
VDISTDALIDLLISYGLPRDILAEIKTKCLNEIPGNKKYEYKEG